MSAEERAEHARLMVEARVAKVLMCPSCGEMVRKVGGVLELVESSEKLPTARKISGAAEEPIRGVEEPQVVRKVGAPGKTAGRGVSGSANAAVETDKERMQREFIERRGK